MGIKRDAADNWFSKCVRERANYTCEVSANPHDFTHWVTASLGEARYEWLMDRKNDTNMAKQLVKDNKAGLIAKHYKEQHKILVEKRQDGETLWTDFESYI